MNYTLDVGPNLFSLGTLFLILKYVVPILAAIVLALVALGVLYFTGRKFLAETFNPENQKAVIIGVFFILLILALLGVM